MFRFNKFAITATWIAFVSICLILPVWLLFLSPRYTIYSFLAVFATFYIYLSQSWLEPSRPDVIYPTGLQLLWRQRKYIAYGPIVFIMRCVAVLFIRWKWDGEDACFMPRRGDLALVMFRYFVFLWYKESDPVFGIEDTKKWRLVTSADWYKIEKYIEQIEEIEQSEKG